MASNFHAKYSNNLEQLNEKISNNSKKRKISNDLIMGANNNILPMKLENNQNSIILKKKSKNPVNQSNITNNNRIFNNNPQMRFNLNDNQKLVPLGGGLTYEANAFNELSGYNNTNNMVVLKSDDEDSDDDDESDIESESPESQNNLVNDKSKARSSKNQSKGGTTSSSSKKVKQTDGNNKSVNTHINSNKGSTGKAARNSKKTKGRVKINMEFIENKIRRYTTFSKRKTGIMKKAYELSTLTGTQVMLLVASETGHVYTFATDKLQPMITSEVGKNLIQSCLSDPLQDELDTTGGSGTNFDQKISIQNFNENDLENFTDDDLNGSNNNFDNESEDQ